MQNWQQAIVLHVGLFSVIPEIYTYVCTLDELPLTTTPPPEQTAHPGQLQKLNVHIRELKL